MFVEPLLEQLPPSISPAARVILLALGDKLGDNASTWPSIETLASLAGCSESTARRSVKELETAGLIRIQKRFTDRGNQTSNAYEIPMLSGPVNLTVGPCQPDTPALSDWKGAPVNLTGGGCQSDTRISPSESPHLNIPREEEGGSSAVALLLRGYQTRYEQRTPDAWMGHSAAMPHIAIVARWAERQAEREGSPVEHVIDRGLDAVFARPGLVKARWPWRKLSEDPARDYRPPKNDSVEFRESIDREVLETKLRNARTFGRADEATKLEQVLGRLEAVR